MGKKRRRGISPGSVLMLLLTALVVAACAVFLASIVGEDIYARTAALISRLSEQGLFALASEGVTPEPEMAGAAAATESRGETAPPAGEAAPPESSAPQSAAFTLAFGGSVSAPRTVRASAEDGAGGYDFSPIFAGLGDALSGADLAVVTLETPAAGETLGYDVYNAPPELLTALRAAGADTLALATERALDAGYDGLEITQREINSRALGCAGIVSADNPSGAEFLQVCGVQVALLSYAYGISDEGRAATRDDERGSVARIDEARMASDITAARLAGANLVVVLPHWGTKNVAETPENVRALARTLAEAGADIIIGAHPNVVQGTERLNVTRSDGLTYESVVCYSLGCLLTDSRAEENTAGMIAKLDVSYDAASRRITLGELTCTPLYIAEERADGESFFRIVNAESERALAALSGGERQNAARAAQAVREASGLAGEKGDELG